MRNMNRSSFKEREEEFCFYRVLSYKVKCHAQRGKSEIYIVFCRKQVYGTKERNKNMKKQKTKEIALYIGKFQPLHKGHVQIIKNILKKYKKVKIAIGSSNKQYQRKNPFTKEERKRMMLSALKEIKIPKQRYQVYFVPDIPSDNKYVKHVRNIVKNYETVFTGYGLNIRLFRKANDKVHTIRRLFNISATKIRRLIKENNNSYKKMIPKSVDPILLEIDAKKRLAQIKK